MGEVTSHTILLTSWLLFQSFSFHTRTNLLDKQVTSNHLVHGGARIAESIILADRLIKSMQVRRVTSLFTKLFLLSFPESSVYKVSACNTGDFSLIPRSGRSIGEEIGYPLQYSWASLWLNW